MRSRDHRDLHSFPTRRSSDLAEPGGDDRRDRLQEGDVLGAERVATGLAEQRSHAPRLAAGAEHGAELVVVALRSESTRLNSSHMSISYAVFCLKKKKHNQ